MKQVDWYFVRNEKTVGPISTGQLVDLIQAKRLSRNDLVWCNRLTEWTPISRIKGLAPPEPPPVPNSTASNQRETKRDAPPVPPEPKNAEEEGNKQRDGESFTEWHVRRLSLVHGMPTPMTWIINGLLWTYGCGFMWIPAWYLIDTSAGATITEKAKSIAKRLPIGTCPSCGENLAREEVCRRLVDKRDGYKTVTRMDKHTAGQRKLFEAPTVTGETERQEQIVVTNSIFLVTYQCKSCGHTWEAHVQTQSQ